MRFIVATVGKPRAEGLAAAIRDYEARAARYWPLEFLEVREEPARTASPELVREREGERLAAKIADAPLVIACDARGETMTSEGFAQWLQGVRERARDAAFLIGGAFGLSHALRERASKRLSLAPWTLPHELARLVLAEQLFRAGTIVRGEPYHK
jgi:23S rRNA (pseudouridine1915-N3)-methyltransferase